MMAAASSQELTAPSTSTSPAPHPSPSHPWSLETLFGRLCEISGSETERATRSRQSRQETQAAGGPAALSVSLRLVHEAQRRGEPAAWITERGSSFFPPDAAATGVDLTALVVVRLPRLQLAPRAADLLLRSGGFGIIVLDLGAAYGLPLAVQTRLSGLARKHHAAVVCLTEKRGDAPSLGSLVSLRIEAVRRRNTSSYSTSSYQACELRALKDKRLGAGWTQRDLYHAPDGLR